MWIGRLEKYQIICLRVRINISKWQDYRSTEHKALHLAGSRAGM